MRHAQIQKMDVIYGFAALTIIAAAGDGPEHGLPGVWQPRTAQRHTFRIGGKTLVVPDFDLPRQILESRWNTRGWTYQEAYLSTRRLVFTDRMVYFHCRAMHCPENIAAPLVAVHTKDLQRLRDTVNIMRVGLAAAMSRSAYRRHRRAHRRVLDPAAQLAERRPQRYRRHIPKV